MTTKWIIALNVAAALLISLFSLPAFAQDKATPEEVLNLILNAVPVMEKLGPEGLEAFKDPKGEFVYKDTYVLVIDCENMVLLAHPNPKFNGISLKDHLDKNPDPAKRKYHDVEVCEVAKRPYGGWVEYYWEKLGETEPSRKISFAIQVPGSNYTLVAGIYDDNASVEELNAKLK